MKRNEPKLRTIFRYCIRVAGCLTVAGFVWMGLIQDAQVRRHHLVPDVPAGRIYTRNIHGGDVYLTRTEFDHCNHVIDGTFALFALTLVGMGIYRQLWGADEEPTVPDVSLRGRSE
ncbi:MAG: hypothetical protein ABR971_14850 [Acidobacteriaceae bacterium]|jgi:hypothetical protein